MFDSYWFRSLTFIAPFLNKKGPRFPPKVNNYHNFIEAATSGRPENDCIWRTLTTDSTPGTSFHGWFLSKQKSSKDTCVFGNRLSISFSFFGSTVVTSLDSHDVSCGLALISKPKRRGVLISSLMGPLIQKPKPRWSM